MTIQTAFQILIKWVFLVVFSLQLQGCDGGSSAPEFGEISINISGLPDDIDADVDVRINIDGQVTT